MEANLCFFSFVYVCIVLPLEIQLSRREGCDPINRFTPSTLLCLVYFMFKDLKVVDNWIVRFVDIGGIVGANSVGITK